MTTPRFLDPIFPDSEWFVLIDEEGTDDGPFEVATFVPHADGSGSWVAQTAGRPVFLRITRQEGAKIWTVDGAGETFVYEMRPLLDIDGRLTLVRHEDVTPGRSD